MRLIAPEAVGLSSERLARIGPAVRARIEKQEMAGAITLVARQGQVAHFQCQGMTDIEAQKPMEADAILRLYSMSKPVTAAAALTLYEEGRYRLDDPVSAFLPTLPPHNGSREQSWQTSPGSARSRPWDG